MMRFVQALLVVLLSLAVVSPAHALTQEELLKRRLEKMQQADPQMHIEEQQREEQFRQSATEIANRPSADPDRLVIPDPVQHSSQPSPDPRGGLWEKSSPQAANQEKNSPRTSSQETLPGQAAMTPAASPAPLAQPSTTPQPAALSPADSRDPKAAAELTVKAAKAKAKGDSKNALRFLNEAVLADPSDPDILNNRGNILSNMGKTREALSDYDRAIAIKRSDSAFFSNRGLAHERLGNQQQACADYQSACDLGECEFLKSYKAEGHCR